MVKAGAPVDAVIDELKPHLGAGRHRRRRRQLPLHRHRPARRRARRRPASSSSAWASAAVRRGRSGARASCRAATRRPTATSRTILVKIAAKADSGPCVTYVGAKSAGHFVKMVHNGIEYGDMQLIAEAYDLMRHGLGLVDRGDRRHLRGVERGRAQVLPHRDHGEDRRRRATIRAARSRSSIRSSTVAGQKGTGKWTTQAALDLGVPIPTITAAVDARIVSAMRPTRLEAAKVYRGSPAAGARVATRRPRSDPLRALRREDLLVRAGLPPPGARPPRRSATACGSTRWRASGRAAASSARSSSTASAPRSSAIRSSRTSSSTRSSPATSGRASTTGAPTVALGVKLGITAPATAASLAYFDGLRRARLPANLIQAQRDFFGAHTYERLDRPGTFHTDWARAAAPAETSTAAAKPARAAAARAPRRR